MPVRLAPRSAMPVRLAPRSAMPPRLVLVLPCCDGLSHLKTCLASLERQTHSSFEVWVIDNGSKDGLSDWVRKTSFPFPVFLHEEAVNQGYARGVNLGVSLSQNKNSSNKDLVVVLNSDLTFDSRFLEVIFKAFSEEEGLELAALHVKNKDGSQTESLGLFLSKHLRGKNSVSGENILGPTGAAFAFRTSLLEKVGIPEGLLYDERYFFLWEDIELALRCHRLGIKTQVLKQSICFHEGNSSGSNKTLRQYLSLRNRFFLIQSYFPHYGRTHFRSLLFYDIPRLIYFFVINPYRFVFLKDLGFSQK